ncbi:hypothetical protein [Phyllobacterium zundukense]|uniref:Uncharacterized protein n=1 Tax=Phyllobacterium zundukense TaxID=1867719 RepID=A0ACD4CZA0_9HYPH|nr:hypothetical protein [Phyllobacterium zundukense]UXN58947.1 hypothetical protein N8E88_08580 [Phyllobacterium zundukense]
MTNEFYDLLIIDDIYPSNFSPFRTIEYNHYMWFFDAAVLSMEGSQLWIENSKIGEHIEKLDLDSKYKSRISSFRDGHKIGGKIAYITFLGNAYKLLPYLTARGLPFILQLYPGGGFAIDQPETDEKLKAVLLSPLCKKVITTQTITKDYIVDKIGCSPEKIEFIFGGVFDSRIDFDYYRDKVVYGKHKETIDLCFVAHKYGDDLVSKGYDYFLEVAQTLEQKFSNLRFHVVGDYSPGDIPLENIAKKTTYYGRQPSSFFADFYPKMDAIVSFNRPFVLMPGAFDGFPTGACLEAGFRGVANIINDPLNLNIAFKDGEDLLILNDDFQSSIEKISRLLADQNALMNLGVGTWRAFHRTMDLDAQLWARTKVIGDELLKHTALVAVAPFTKSSLDGEPLRLQTQNILHEKNHLQAELDRALSRIARLDSELSQWQRVVEHVSKGVPYRAYAKVKAFARRNLNFGG